MAQRRALADHLVPHFDGALERCGSRRRSRVWSSALRIVTQHPLARQRLLDEVERAGLGRFDGGADRAVAGDDHHRQRLVDRLDALQRLEAVHAGHLDVEEDEIGRLLLGERHAFRPARRLEHVVALVLEDHPHRPPDLRLVVYDQNARLHRGTVLRITSQTSRTLICESRARDRSGHRRLDRALLDRHRHERPLGRASDRRRTAPGCRRAWPPRRCAGSRRRSRPAAG